MLATTTTQAATASSLSADAILREAPGEGDGFTYEHYESRDELWLDFIAGVGVVCSVCS